MKLLLHVCCAPCLAAALEKLQKSFEITAFFYNPNIHPAKEHSRRLKEFTLHAGREKIAITEGFYEPQKWFDRIKGMENEEEGGARCPECFRMRIEKTAAKAESLGIKNIASTLTAGPGKKAGLINNIGAEIAKKYSVNFLCEDFKKKDGFKKALDICKKFDIYRQNYCGCLFSKEINKCAE